MIITPLYAGLLALLFVVLSFRVIGLRRARGINLGDGGDPELQRRTRIHANFAEYVPLAVILLALAENSNTPALALHFLGTMLIVGRLAHAYGVGTETIPLRVLGMILTLTAIIIAASINLGALTLLYLTVGT